MAKVLKLNPQTIRNWIDQGALPAYRLGRRVRIGRADFLALLDPSGAGTRDVADGRAFWEGEYVPEGSMPSS